MDSIDVFGSIYPQDIFCPKEIVFKSTVSEISFWRNASFVSFYFIFFSK